MLYVYVNIGRIKSVCSVLLTVRAQRPGHETCLLVTSDRTLSSLRQIYLKRSCGVWTREHIFFHITKQTSCTKLTNHYKLFVQNYFFKISKFGIC